MKYWLVAAVFAAACASAEPAQTQRPEMAEDRGGPVYADARDVASDAEVRDARRAYRAACQTRHSDAYCECMTGGMAQILPPQELAVATAAFSGRAVQAPQDVRDRVEARRTEVDRGCMQFRR